MPLAPILDVPALRARAWKAWDERVRLRVNGLLLPFAVILLVVGVGWWLIRSSHQQTVEWLDPATATTRTTAVVSNVGASPTSTAEVPAVEEIVVHVSGAVATSGVQRLPVGSRVNDAVNAAGGLLSSADLDRINLASRLTDGQRVILPKKGEPLPGAGPAGESPSSPAANPSDAKIDLNTAEVSNLDALPGVGPSIAQAIIDYRTKVGRFRTVDDLSKVKGIGPAKLQQIRPRVTVTQIR